MLSDTVGFISNLPTQLVAAFRATLEEVLEADVILHVRDISHEDAEAQQSDVDAVLRQLGINPDDSGRIIEVWNKIDRYDAEQREELLNIAARRPEDHPAMLVSAVSGEGIDALLAAIEERLAAKAHHARSLHRRRRRRRHQLAAPQCRGAGERAARRPLRHDRAGGRDQAGYRGEPVRRRAASCRVSPNKSDATCSPDGAKRNPGQPGATRPDCASLHPGYALKGVSRREFIRTLEWNGQARIFRLRLGIGDAVDLDPTLVQQRNDAALVR